MATIHPTAVVEKNVQLAEDVVIGPYCVVGKRRLDRRRDDPRCPGGHHRQRSPIGRENRFYPELRDRLLSAGPRDGPGVRRWAAS